MNKWVDCLCCVLGLKENEEKPPAQQRPEPEPVAPPHERQALPRTTSIPHSSSRPSPLPPKVTSHTLPSKISEQQEPYLHLDDCYSAKPPSPGSFLSQVPPPPHSVNKLSKQPSIPDEIAPAPPTKTGTRIFDSAVGDSDGNDDVYDAPRSYVNMETMDANENLLYKYPRPQQAGEIKHVMEPYDQPRPQAREPYDFPRATQDTYNIPPRSTADTYNVPRPHRTVSRIPETPPHTQQVFPPKHDTNSIYKMPLLQMEVGHGVRVDSTYDVPPKGGPTQLTREPSLRDSNSSNGSRTSNVHGDSGFESGDTEFSRASRAVRTSDVYDYPPPQTAPHHDLFVSVPPPHYSQKGDRSPPKNEVSYMNLPSNSKAHPEYVPPDQNPCHAPSARTTMIDDDTYDVPPMTRRQSDVDMLNMTPPPPPPCTFKQHRYVNAPTGYVPKETDVYMPMQGTEGEDTYLPMQSPPTRHSSIVIENSRMSSNTDDGIYGVPPSGRPVTRNVSDLVPPPLMQRASTKHSKKIADLALRDDDSYICQTNRTKSFRRNLDIRPNTEVRLPTKLSSQGDLSSSSEDDMDTMSNNSYSSHDRSLDENIDRISRSSDPKTIIPARKGLNSTPPPPPKKGGEVLYLDLDLEKSSEPDKSPGQARTPVVVMGNRSPTDYKEIDFVRTMALSEMRKDLENKRKSSERSVDD